MNDNETAADVIETGWIITNGRDGAERRFRKWGDLGPIWTVEPLDALHFARRRDAETFATGEDAWCIVSVDLANSLADRLARCLAEAVDTPIMSVRDVMGGSPIELRLGAWLPEVSERAAELLEEAGR